MKNNIIGRKSEQDTLARIYESRQSEFVAVCGRRRVGKTFLVREYFEQEMVFQTSGLAGGNTQEQLSAVMVFSGICIQALPRMKWCSMICFELHF